MDGPRAGHRGRVSAQRVRHRVLWPGRSSRMGARRRTQHPRPAAEQARRTGPAAAAGPGCLHRIIVPSGHRQDIVVRGTEEQRWRFRVAFSVALDTGGDLDAVRRSLAETRISPFGFFPLGRGYASTTPGSATRQALPSSKTCSSVSGSWSWSAVSDCNGICLSPCVGGATRDYHGWFRCCIGSAPAPPGSSLAPPSPVPGATGCSFCPSVGDRTRAASRIQRSRRRPSSTAQWRRTIQKEATVHPMLRLRGGMQIPAISPTGKTFQKESTRHLALGIRGGMRRQQATTPRSRRMAMLAAGRGRSGCPAEVRKITGEEGLEEDEFDDQARIDFEVCCGFRVFV